MIKETMTDYNYYVYLHRKKSDGAVFYVGKGRGLRLNDRRRGAAWRRVVEECGGFTSEIYKDNLSSRHACDLENYLIVNPEETLTAARNFRDNILKEYYDNNYPITDTSTAEE